MEQLRSAFGRGAPEGSIYDILKTEHRQIKASLAEIINSGRVQKDVFAQTIAALEMHMKGEENLFYPRLERSTYTRMWALKAYEEHHLARMSINDMNAAPADERWLAKIRVLYDILNRHIDEEENDIFPGARRVLSDNEAMQLGRDYRTQGSPSQPQPIPMPPREPSEPSTVPAPPRPTEE